MKLVRRVGGIALFVAVLVVGWRFAASNAGPVTVDLLLERAPDVPLWVALLLAFGSGAAVTGVYALYKVARASLEVRRYRKAVASLEAEIHQLRNLPLVAESAAPPVRALPGREAEPGAPAARRGV
jgi:uncharacterized integral membrane protein